MKHSLVFAGLGSLALVVAAGFYLGLHHEIRYRLRRRRRGGFIQWR